MLLLRVFGDSPAISDLAERLQSLAGTSHVSVSERDGARTALVTADVRAAAADKVLAMVRDDGVAAADISLLRIDEVSAGVAGDETLAVVWADLIGQARVNARTAARYLVFMSVAGVIAAFGVIDKDQILIVGAMAVSPDLLPVTAACTGIVLGRPGLAARGLLSLAVGLAVAGALAAAITGFLNVFELLPAGFVADGVGFASNKHVEAETVFVAFAAGVAGMLAVETRASAGVGVAISVTTIPAVAFLGVAAGIGELSKSQSALVVLGVNVAMMVIGGSLALAVQRRLRPRAD